MLTKLKEPSLEELLAAVEGQEASREDYKITDDVTNWIITTGVKPGTVSFTIYFLYQLYEHWSLAALPFFKFEEIIKKNIPIDPNARKKYLLDSDSIEPLRQQLLKQIGTRRFEKKAKKRRTKKKSEVSRS